MIRPATKADLTAIRDLQIASWRKSYAELLPQEFLAADVVDVLSERWAQLPGETWSVDAAWTKDALAGFVSVDWTHQGGAYVDNLHVDPEVQGQGIGRRLMAAVASQLVKAGHSSLWLTVIKGNSQARAFYRGIGGIEGEEQLELLYGQPVTTYPVRWSELPDLAAFGRG